VLLEVQEIQEQQELKVLLVTLEELDFRVLVNPDNLVTLELQ
jgi:hypothetical protein